MPTYLKVGSLLEDPCHLPYRLPRAVKKRQRPKPPARSEMRSTGLSKTKAQSKQQSGQGPTTKVSANLRLSDWVVPDFQKWAMQRLHRLSTVSPSMESLCDTVSKVARVPYQLDRDHRRSL